MARPPPSPWLPAGGSRPQADGSSDDQPDLIRNGSSEEGLDAAGAPRRWRISIAKGERGFVDLTEEHASDGRYAVHVRKQGMVEPVGLSRAVRLRPDTGYVSELRFAPACSARHDEAGPDQRCRRCAGRNCRVSPLLFVPSAFAPRRHLL